MDMADELVKELEFNAAYLIDKYGLDSLVILGSECDDKNGDVMSFEVMKGNRYSNIELCRKVITIEEEMYKEYNYINNGEDDNGEV